ncbi:hypothetical protein [Paenibacillus radicis (ex Xue et al. 2023)]|uniref:Secreted protein n=1 Tax=Paenibacillus radicis (ex Xue et al. 2023) TaxID=2972489 RepID=A0ABT1YNI0_9BACL|nr:hypothetical protein [Paenibacillus radicis (ex Xue et al. 2023)]MCR8634727.1 hypothetical protein [Paenibacillus radicis (ex Xue et al. 2023)]
MRKTLVVLLAIIAFSTLTACGSSKGAVTAGESHPSGHGGGHGQGNAADKIGGDAAQDKLKASFAFGDGGVNANQDTEVMIQITGEDGTPVKQFKENHEKLMHLIVVSQDLSFFNHIHPDYQGNGKFTVKTRFPAGGKFKVFADFIPAGGSNSTKSEWVQVKGQEAAPIEVKPDSSLIKQVGDKEIELKLSGTKAKEEVTLTFNIRDAATKKGISNLQPYLGAVGHVVILSRDAEQYLHVHPVDEKASGPDAKFATSFPQSGIYKIWGQFQHEGKVFTVPFVVDVK